MDLARVEQLLEERGRRLTSATDASSLSDRARTALVKERLRIRRARYLRLGSLAAAAAVLLMLFVWRSPDAPVLDGLAVQVAVLDASGRELRAGSEVRGGAEVFPRPDSAHLEVVAPADGFVRILLFDERGRLHARQEGEPGKLVAGKAYLESFDLRSLGAEPSQPSEISWLVVTAKQPFSLEALQLPTALVGPDRRVELDQLASRLARDTGCAVTVRTLLLESSQ
jgi:hypothetical protein